MKETPHAWVILKITHQSNTPIYKLFASWLGGYLDGDYWRLNSGITNINQQGDLLIVSGYTKTQYHCNINNYSVKGYHNELALQDILTKGNAITDTTIQVMPPDTQWTQLINTTK